MAISTKIIRRRIRSITNTKKITKAMELVSAAKMRRAVERTLASRAYAGTAWELVLRLAARTESRFHPLFAVREPARKIAIITVSSNRGLCGAFNTNIARTALGIEAEGATIEYVTIGKKARDMIRRIGKQIVADFEKPDVTTSITEVTALARMMIDGFLQKTYDRVFVAYTDFVSSLRQTPRATLLLPFERPSPKEASEGKYEYLFEPNPDTVLAYLLPRLIELQLYQAVLESDASEHSARMLAMRNATDAAGDMIADLTLAFNQARQAGITREIAEISGGKAALEG